MLQTGRDHIRNEHHDHFVELCQNKVMQGRPEQSFHGQRGTIYSFSFLQGDFFITIIHGIFRISELMAMISHEEC